MRANHINLTKKGYDVKKIAHHPISLYFFPEMSMFQMTAIKVHGKQYHEHASVLPCFKSVHVDFHTVKLIETSNFLKGKYTFKNLTPCGIF